VTVGETWAEMVAAIHSRLPGATAEAVAAAVETAGIAQGGFARFVNRLQTLAEEGWPRVAVTGKVAYD
jgi:hypothetical protein